MATQAGRISCNPSSVTACLSLCPSLQLLRQATGINPVFVYDTQIFKDVRRNGLTTCIRFSDCQVKLSQYDPRYVWVGIFGPRSLL
jgi:SP family sugar:H+ symporter-like MFS transporter